MIQNDLIHHKLIHGLELLQVDASEYLLYLNTSIFKLMGFRKAQRSNALYLHYFECCHEAQGLELKGDRRDLEALSLKIYHRMLQMKQAQYSR